MFEPQRTRRVGEISTVSFSRVARAIDALEESETSWFDGSRTSIRERREKVSRLIHECRKALAGEVLSLPQQAELQDFVTKAGQVESVLREVEAEFVDHDVQESLQALPTYHVMVAGEQRLGEQSDLSIADVAPLQSTSWREFLEVEPGLFVRDNLNTVADSGEMRERAINFVTAHTGNLHSLVLRSSVIEDFVTSVERERRGALRDASTSRVTQRVASAVDLERLPDSALYS